MRFFGQLLIRPTTKKQVGVVASVCKGQYRFFLISADIVTRCPSQCLIPAGGSSEMCLRELFSDSPATLAGSRSMITQQGAVQTLNVAVPLPRCLDHTPKTLGTGCRLGPLPVNVNRARYPPDSHHILKEKQIDQGDHCKHTHQKRCQNISWGQQGRVAGLGQVFRPSYKS